MLRDGGLLLPNTAMRAPMQQFIEPVHLAGRRRSSWYNSSTLPDGIAEKRWKALPLNRKSWPGGWKRTTQRHRALRRRPFATISPNRIANVVRSPKNKLSGEFQAPFQAPQ